MHHLVFNGWVDRIGPVKYNARAFLASAGSTGGRAEPQEIGQAVILIGSVLYTALHCHNLQRDADGKSTCAARPECISVTMQH